MQQLTAQNSQSDGGDNFESNLQSFHGLLRSVRLDEHRPCCDFEAYLERVRVRIIKEITQQLHELHSAKVQLKIVAEYEKPPIVQQTGGALERARRMAKRRRYEQKEKDVQVATIGLATKFTPIIDATNIRPTVQRLLAELRQRHINSIQLGSGFTLRTIVSADLLVGRYTPLAGSSYIGLPDFLARKKCIVNVQNNDHRCFGYAVLAALLHCGKHSERPGQYDPYFQQYGLHRIDYPVKIDDLEEVESHINISFNVFTFFDDEGKGRKPVYTSRIGDPQSAIDLLFWQNDGVQHYAWIKSFNSFVYDLHKQQQNRCFWCKRCFCHFYLESAFHTHIQSCKGAEGFKCIHQLPPQGTVLEFKNIKYEERVPFVIYADFECLTTLVAPQENAPEVEPACGGDIEMQGAAADTRIDDDERSTSLNRERGTPKNAYQIHKPISVGMKLISSVPGILDKEPYKTYTGADVTDWFLDRLLKYQEMCTRFLFDEARMVMTPHDKVAHAAATACYICEKPFGKTKGLQKVRDHDHVSGEYRGAAHSSCNLLKRRQRKIPIFFHNFRGYDSHLIVPALGKHKDQELRVIAQTMEKYLQLQFGDHLVYKDSLQFLSCSLERLTQNLLTSGRQFFTHLLHSFNQQSDANVDLLLRKGVYPYDYMSDAVKLQEKHLPPREAFFNRLRQAECSVEDHEHAKRVWTAFNCKTMQDYHDLYLKCDVLQLADVFEAFRTTAMGQYSLDPAHYVSAPHLSWDAMLRSTRCKLDLLWDDAMFSMIQQNLRGGVAMISKRHGKANNKYLKEHYDPNQPSKYLMYVDANNLYGWAMSQPLPDGKFEWVPEAGWRSIDWLAQTADQDTGYIVECDLDYPDHLHDTHSDYPLAPERLTVATHMLSDTQREHMDAYNTTKSNTKMSKLIPNLFPKHNYACHYMNLRFYLEHGLVLSKVHRVIRFHQSRWLAPYISKNSELRAKARNAFEKDFYKLMNNAVYGKTCENVLKRQDIRIVTDYEKTKKLIEKPHCLGYRIFTQNIAAVAMQKIAAKVDKPTYVGLAVLEYSKLHMFRFHYDQVLKQWPNGKARLILTDTDSLLYEIETQDVYEDIQYNPTLRDWFDLSNYSMDHPLYSSANKMVIGKMKDETAGEIMYEVVGLRAKMYSFKVYDPVTGRFKETKKAKGIQKAAMETVTHEQYLKQLLSPVENRLTVRRIGQELHTVFTFEQQKRGLCAFDDKRYLLEDRIDTLAHGHYKIRDKQQENDSAPQSTTASANGTSVFTDDDGDEHLIATQLAVSESPVLCGMFQGNNDDGEEGDTLLVDENSERELLQQRTSETSSTQQTSRPRVQSTSSSNERFADQDSEAVDLLVTMALVDLRDPLVQVGDRVAALKSRMRSHADTAVYERALQHLDAARSSDKMLGLSESEQLIFMAVKSAKVSTASRNIHPHKDLFMLLTGRTANWWDRHHKRILDSIVKPRALHT